MTVWKNKTKKQQQQFTTENISQKKGCQEISSCALNASSQKASTRSCFTVKQDATTVNKDIQWQVGKRHRSNHTRFLLSFYKRWELDHACRYSLEFHELTTRGEKKNALRKKKPHVRDNLYAEQPSSNTLVGFQIWAWWSQGKWPSEKPGQQCSHYKL